MKKAEVLALLESERNERGVAKWEKDPSKTGGLKSHGIGLTRLRKLAKEVGSDAKLAKQLWRTKLYDAKVLSLLIDDPKAMSVEQAEQQVEELAGGHLAHVFSSCDATLAKAPFARELMERWVLADDPRRRDAGYGLLYEISKWRKKTAPTEAEFLDHVKRIEKTCRGQPIPVQLGMGASLLGIGKRSKKLHAACLKAAKKMGPVEFDPKCDPFDAAKNLNHEVVRGRLGL